MEKTNDLKNIISCYKLTKESRAIDIMSAVIDYNYGHSKWWSEVKIRNCFKVLKSFLCD